MRFVVSSVAAAVVLAAATYGLDAVGGTPAESAPAALFAVWFIIVVAVRGGWRLARRTRKRAPRHPEG